jgi:hypothetical protein
MSWWVAGWWRGPPPSPLRPCLGRRIFTGKSKEIQTQERKENGAFGTKESNPFFPLECCSFLGFHRKGKIYSDLWFFIPARKPEVTITFNSSDGVVYLYAMIV